MKGNHIVADATPTARMTKSEANQENAHKSTGPKTARGKSHSSHNAFKHGLYSEELVISEADQPEFDALRTGLRAQLKPCTLLRENACDYVVVCNWRVKLGVRLEQRQFARQLQSEQEESPPDDAANVDGFVQRWYGCGRSDIRTAIGSIEYAKKEFYGCGYFREETKTFLKRGFGADFFRVLEEWIPPRNQQAILFAEHLIEHDKRFPRPNSKVQSDLREMRVVLDPTQSQQMVCKLLDERGNFLRELRVIADRNTLGRPDVVLSSDFNPRFLADANRELRRALEWYRYLEEQGL